MCSFASAAILVFQYVQEFCHKACCYDDVVMIIDRLREDERVALEEALDKYKSVVKDPAGNYLLQSQMSKEAFSRFKYVTSFTEVFPKLLTLFNNNVNISVAIVRRLWR